MPPPPPGRCFLQLCLVLSAASCISAFPIITREDSEEKPVNIASVQQCARVGFPIGVLGMVSIVIMLLQYILALFERSPLLPWKSSLEVSSRTVEFIISISVILLGLVVFGLTVANIVRSKPDDCPIDAVVHLAVIRASLSGIALVNSILMNARRLALVRNLYRYSDPNSKFDVYVIQDPDRPRRYRKQLLIFGVLMGLAGWAYWYPYLMLTRNLSLLDQLPSNRLVLAAFWGGTVLIVFVALLLGLVSKMTQFDSMRWANIPYAIVFFGGLASAVYVELSVGLIFGTLVMLPDTYRRGITVTQMLGMILVHATIGR